MSERSMHASSPLGEEKASRKRKGKISWWLPLIYALPFAAAGAAAALLWGRDIRNLIQVLIKLVVKA